MLFIFSDKFIFSRHFFFSIVTDTFEVLDASASPPTPPEPGMLIFTGNFTKYAGGCFIVVPDGGGHGQDKCILVKLQDTRSSATQSVTGFSSGIQQPRIYDLEKDGKVGKRPAVIISSAMVEDGGVNRKYMYCIRNCRINPLYFYVVGARELVCMHRVC